MSPPDLAPLTGCIVGHILLDYRVSLGLASQDGKYGERVDAILVIGAPFEVSSDRATERVTPDDTANYAAVLPLLHATVADAIIASDESLRVSFENGFSLTVPRHQHYESWEISGRGVAGWIAGSC